MITPPDQIYLTNIGATDDEYSWCETKVGDDDILYEKVTATESEDEKSAQEIVLISVIAAKLFLKTEQYRFLAGDVLSNKETKQQESEMSKGLYRALQILSDEPEHRILFDLLYKTLGAKKLRKAG